MSALRWYQAYAPTAFGLPPLLEAEAEVVVGSDLDVRAGEQEVHEVRAGAGRVLRVRSLQLHVRGPGGG
jgi:hypothetical protein